RPGAQGRDRIEQLGLDVLAGPQDEGGVSAHRFGGGQEVLALGDEQSLALAVLALVELADELELVVVLAGDHSSSATKKGAWWGAPVKSRAAGVQAATASRACSANRR